MSLRVRLEDIENARHELRSFLTPTPLVRNAWLSDHFGCDLYFKLETMQPIGSFKIRGATFKILKLSAQQRRRGVIAASAGNHAQGVAWGSRRLGCKATIVMPTNAPLTKIQNTKALGAEVILQGTRYDECYEIALKLSKLKKLTMVHAYEDADVIAGQGTIGLEILDDLPDPDFVMGSVGGGGLMAGVGVVFSALKHPAKIIGCQAAGAPSMYESFKKKHAITLPSVDTIADGVAVRKASPSMYSLLHHSLDQIKLADDDEIASAVLMLMEKAKLIAEGACAIPLAVLETMKREIHGKKVVLILGGGNIDVNVLSRIIDRGLIRAGRRLRVNVVLSDRPGSLARLTDTIAKVGANVLQAIHDRNEPSTQIDETDVQLTLETRSPEHSRELIKALKGQVLRLEMAH